ncbi:MAG: DNRLRE domain-containing protein [Chloroflexi bacterium]|nr:DNRLRE domain-containing protein [Chloroflexota bacterium]MDA1173758.1 DNRLRE domain-containing protein [Chloroflexota bacterium]
MFSRLHTPTMAVGILVAIFVSVASACAAEPSAPPTPTPTPNPNVVRLTPSQDATLFEHHIGGLASSTGANNFVGMTNRNVRRRMLIAFDLSSLPANREIVAATLEMRMSKSASGAFDVSLHRVTTAWAEGTSAASGMGGKGTASVPGDPTWIHSAYPNTLWTTDGGDYVAEPSATTSVDNFVRYSWTGPGLVDDIHAWTSRAAPNFGWLAIGDEAHQKTAKRFDSREHSNVDRRPTLVIELAPLP